MPMPNVIYKLVQLILDKTAAHKMEDDAKQSVGKVDQELNLLQRTAQRLATALAAAFAIQKIVSFARESVRAAMESDRVWSSLRQTVTAVGGDFDSLGPRIRRQADAFAAATIHDDDSFAESLQRLIVLTGDTQASMNNMGLVANVAAAFFEGDLAPAAELVAKVMNGNVSILGRMGIEAETAQEGLEILASRSMGAATKETQTFSGQLAQLNNLWGEFKEDVGGAIIGADGATNSFGLLQGVLVSLREWVAKNDDRIREWISRGINWTIIAIDALYRAVTGLGNLLQGGFNTALGIAVKGVAYITQGFAAAVSAGARFQEITGQKSAADARAYADSVKAAAEALHEWADAAIAAGSAQVAEGVERFTTPVFTAPSAPTAQTPELEVNAPMVADHRMTLDELAKFDEDYWRKRIRLTNQGMATIKAAEQSLGEGIRSELTATQEIAAELGAELVGAMGAGIGPAAAGKARQNALEAAELTIRAGIASLNPFTAWMAPGYLSSAAAHAGLAVAWGALSAGFGGAGGGADVPTVGGGVSAASQSAGAASDATPPGVHVVIHIDGIDPNSTRHQALLAATNQQVRERYGENSQITVIPA